MGISEEGGSREEEISHFSISNPSSGSDVITVGLSSGTSRSVERRNARAPLIYLLSNTHETPPPLSCSEYFNCLDKTRPRPLRVRIVIGKTTG